MENRFCWRCNKPYTPTGRNQKYCDACKKPAENEKELDRYYKLMADSKERKKIREQWKRNHKVQTARMRLLKKISRLKSELKQLEKELPYTN